MDFLSCLQQCARSLGGTEQLVIVNLLLKLYNLNYEPWKIAFTV
jgi:hypothetical protein